MQSYWMSRLIFGNATSAACCQIASDGCPTHSRPYCCLNASHKAEVDPLSR